ncbi:DUF1152 domain-containing protein [Streptomyces lydicamycinicus]|uniref:DUF1152 domain-containing protein n=1 Tax=Streptomyces lydicamycinicus TaxID=1546107 RepID=UPI00269FC0E5|nr:DUF1152 domain-containing protein [Streptomyces lydicamycinicus]
MYEADLDEALNRNQLARAILTTENLHQVEQHSRDICGFSEIDYERNKSSWLGSQSAQRLDPETVLHRLDEFEADARSRGINHTTFRRLAEAFGLSDTQPRTSGHYCSAAARSSTRPCPAGARASHSNQPSDAREGVRLG